MIKETLIAAIIAVESAGNPHAVGDGGRAHGILQIHAATVRDVNRIAGTAYTLRDTRDPEIARFICVTYLEHYGSTRRLGRKATDEDFARIWNGGPHGWHKVSTVRYWHKVRSRMIEIESDD